jgi:hypothetical protein
MGHLLGDAHASTAGQFEAREERLTEREVST